MNKTRAVIATTLVVVTTCLLFSSCNRKPNKPVEPELTDYVFYFNDASYYDRYYSYHSATLEVDSFTIPFASRTSFAVSADGDRLYLSDGAMTRVVTTDSFDLITELPYGGRVAISSDNQYVAIIGPDIRILATSDFSVVYHDTSSASSAVFSRNSQRLYCVGGPGTIMLDLSVTPYNITRLDIPRGIVLQAVPSEDESKLFLYMKFDTFIYAFQVLDMNTDSIIFEDVLSPGAGEIVTTPDGRYVFYTNPGTLLIGPQPGNAVMVFDINGNMVFDTIVTPSPVNNYMFPQNLAITPDGMRLITDGAAGQGEFSVIDVQQMKVIEYYYLGNQVDIWNVTCQNAL